MNTANLGFFGGANLNFGPYEASSRRGRALALLHELAHLIGQVGPDGNVSWLIPTDGNVPGQSERNTETVLAQCQSEIENQIPE